MGRAYRGRRRRRRRRRRRSRLGPRVIRNAKNISKFLPFPPWGLPHEMGVPAGQRILSETTSPRANNKCEMDERERMRLSPSKHT